MKRSIELTICQSRIAEVSAVVARNYGIDHVMTREEMLRYFFGDASDHNQNLTVCGYFDGVLRGILGYMPLTIRWGENDYFTGAWTSMWGVDEAYRQGAGILLMRKLQESFPVILGQGANELNRKIVNKMNNIFLDKIPRAILVLQTGNIKSAISSGRERYSQAANALEGSRAPGATSRSVRSVKYLDKRQYDPDWSQFSYYRYGTLRTLSYLKWRYIKHPFFDYEILIDGPPSTPELLVFRVERGFGDFALNAIRIVEFIVSDVPGSRERALQLIKKLKDIAVAYTVDYVDFYCTCRRVLEFFTESGFELELEPVVPNLLSPLVRTARAQNLEIYLDPKLQAPSWEEIYVTKSDGDQDRPALRHLAGNDV